jgi:ketosteroid isomerase-like protein
MSHGQETDDTQAIRALMTADQKAWNTGDVKGILGHMDEHYTVFRAPTVDGELDFNGIEVAATPDGLRDWLNDPEFARARKEASADTLLDRQSSHELSRIDVKGDYAVAVSRIEWSRNDTTAAEPTRESGGWESVWFLRKVDGSWLFTGALGYVKTW